MGVIKLNNHVNAKIKGNVRLLLVDTKGQVVKHVEFHNEFTDLAESIILNTIRGTERIKEIHVGTGGDLDPTTLVDTGARVAPVGTETTIRRKVFEMPIQYTAASGSTVELYGAARPESFTSTEINELALITTDNNMLSHWVSIADPATGRATDYTKTEFMWLVVKWEIVLNAEYI